MKWLDWADRRLRWLAVPHVTITLIFFQSVAWLLMQQRPELFLQLVLFRDAVIQHGEWWRLISFVFLPPTANALFLFFALYFFYLMGTALEAQWGTVRYNLYLLISYAATVAVTMLLPANGIGTNAYMMGSVFLAFAYLYPDFQILLFFILPIRVKWIALVTWLGFAWVILVGSWLARLLTLAAVLNFLLFFGVEVLRTARRGNRTMRQRAKALADAEVPFNTCTICGITERSNPQAEFRYCGQCKGTLCYCLQHIHNHAHRI